jgi:hypothetical protein
LARGRKIYPVKTNDCKSLNMKFQIVSIALFMTHLLQAQVIPFYSPDNDKYGYKEKTGKVIVEPKYDLAYDFDEGLAAVRLNGKYGYVDVKGREVVPLKYENTWKFIGGYAAVKLDGKFGFIDKEGAEVIPPIYENAYNYHGSCCYRGMAHVKFAGKWKIIRIGPETKN